MFYWHRIVTPLNLEEAWRTVRRGRGAPGMDGISIKDFQADYEFYLLSLQELLRAGTYRPRPLRRVDVPKPDGDTRPIQVPSVLDRVVGRAVLNIIAPDLELTFSPASYAYRRGRSTSSAVRDATACVSDGAKWVVKADIKRYFDSIRHESLLQCLSETFTEQRVLDLLTLFVRHHASNGATLEAIGIAQGCVLSPLFANLYLNAFDNRLAKLGIDVFRYADDLLLLTRTKREAVAGKRAAGLALASYGLELKPGKTVLRRIEHGVEFLGFFLDARGASIPQEATRRFCTRVESLLDRASRRRVETLVSFVLSWLAYYRGVVKESDIAMVGSSLEDLLRQYRVRLWRGAHLRPDDILRLCRIDGERNHGDES